MTSLFLSFLSSFSLFCIPYEFEDDLPFPLGQTNAGRKPPSPFSSSRVFSFLEVLSMTTS